MDKQQVIQLAQQDPNVARAADEIQQQVMAEDVPIEVIGELIEMLEYALDNPAQYPALIAAAVEEDLLDAGDLPEQFDATFVVAMLAVLYELQSRMQRGVSNFARGGLAQLARMGRGDDTMLAHISPQEAALLKVAGGSGTINPRTGLPEFLNLKKAFKSVAKIAVPVALTFIAPGVGTAIGSAVIGGVTAAATGGDPLKGAVLGGLTAGLGGSLGGAANRALGLGLGATGQAVLGSGLTGAITSALSGQNVAKGAAMGALGGFAGRSLQGVGSGAVGAGLGAGAKTFGDMLAAGYKPREAVLGGGLSGLAVGLQRGAASRPDSNVGFKRPADAVVDGLRAPAINANSAPAGGLQADYSLTGNGLTAITPGAADYSLTGTTAPAAPTIAAPAAPGLEGVAGSGLRMTGSNPLGANIGTAASPASTIGRLTQGISNMTPTQMLTGAALLGSLSSAPPQVQQAVQEMPAAQREYFNRPTAAFDWDKMQLDASASGMDLTSYMAQNWSRIASGYYNAPTQSEQPVQMARGGALAALGQLVSGSGSGRDDTIPAKLSDGEYVIDAETVALLGDGSNKEGARRLDAMRESIRAHKGKTLARGKFSPNAKSPLAYLKGMK